MRVLLVTGSLPPLRCGVGDYTLRLARALVEAGCEVAALTTAGAAPIPGDAPIEVFPIMPDWTARRARLVRKTIRAWRPDVVHIQVPTFGYGMGFLPYLVPAIARLCGVRAVVTAHELSKWDRLYDAADPPVAARYAALALAGSEFVVVRPGLRGQLHPLLQHLASERRFHFIPNGSSIARSTLDEPARQALRAKLANGQRRLLAFFGFMFPQKGAELLFDIADPVTDTIILAGEEAPLVSDQAASIRALAASERWRGKAIVWGHRPEHEVADLLAAADAVVLPYRTGGGIWNSSIHAAVAQGTPVVTTASDGPRHDAARNVYFARPGDIAGLRDAVDRLARADSASRQEPPDEWRAIAEAHLAVYRGTS